MNFMVRILRYLIWLLVVSWGVAILRRLVGEMGSGAGRVRPTDALPEAEADQKLVRDPVCGMHVAERLAVEVRQGAETRYFCSTECRDKFLGATEKFVANL